MALAAAALVAAQAQPATPSFDCRRAASAGEKIVCADPTLAEADRRMAAEYRAALATSGDAPALRLAQRKALADRDACGTRACVAHWYDARTRSLATPPGPPSPPRLAVGRCTVTQVAKVGPRVEGAPDSGAFIAYADGLAQVSYEALPGMRQARPGDPVRLCLVSRPRGCPAGDMRGSVYTAQNRRTGASWTAGDSSHQCGGA